VSTFAQMNICGIWWVTNGCNQKVTNTGFERTFILHTEAMYRVHNSPFEKQSDANTTNKRKKAKAA